MTQQSKLIILIAYLLILSAVMLSYRVNRAKKIKRLQADIAGVSAQKDKTRAAEAEAARLARLIPDAADTPAFIESLYGAARESGLTQHEVTTEAEKSGGGAARPGGSGGASIVARQRLKVSASGNFRSFAEYIRRVQNMERFNRIMEFRLVPDADQIKGTLAIELYYLPAKHAN